MTDPTPKYQTGNEINVDGFQEQSLSRAVRLPDAEKGIALLIAAVCIVLALGAFGIADRVTVALDLGALRDVDLCSPGLIAVLLVYMVLLACPFVPGAEIGLGLLVLFGADAAPFVYLATVGALSLSFSIGRFVPARATAWLLRRLGLEHVEETAFARRSDPRIGQSTARPLKIWQRALRRVSKHRSLVLAVLINTPGNSALGGGGGIALAVGVGRLMPFGRFLVSVAFAVAPVPVAVWCLGWPFGS